MVDDTLSKLSQDMGLADKLQKGNVSLAGHSHGGAALGAAGVGLGANDITLQDAGYGWYGSSWKQLEQWFVTGTPVKHLRVISKDAPDAKDKTHAASSVGNTRSVLHSGMARADVMRVAKEHKLPNPEVEPVDGDKATARDGGMTLDGGFDFKIDGKLQARLRIFSIDPQLPKGSPGGKHWGVKDETMAASMRANNADDDFGVTKP
jgi:hypothetical protein